MKYPFFSIVTVCYNSDKTIEQTIRSVLAQTYQDFEYIVIDGASTDNTLNIVKRYSEKVEYKNKIRVYSEKDKGIYDAFNKGCRKAKGTYVWLVNSDDYIERDALSIVFEKVKAFSDAYPIVSGSVRFVYSNGMSPTIKRIDKVIAQRRYEQIGRAHV